LPEADVDLEKWFLPHPADTDMELENRPVSDTSFPPFPRFKA
jgi:hypothetical protein